MKEKLIHNFHELTHLEKIFYLFFLRPFWPKEKRFFFEGSLLLPGQMYIEDRKALFNIILEKKPKQCFEIGTYTGGGSTYFLSSAFHKLGSGKVITMENDVRLFNKAKKYYEKRLVHLKSHIEFVLGENFNCLAPFIENGSIDCVFLDGAEDSNQTLEQYNQFLPYFHKGSILIMHDWNTEKTRLLKPLILESQNWKIIKEIQPPESVGFLIAEMI